MKNAFKYTFRFCCDPGFNDKSELSALARYVGEAAIDDVAVFANVQEINTGHMTFDEQKPYLQLMQSVKEMMSEKGVTMSVNHWHSVMHSDLGKKLKDGQSFRTMVDVKGNKSTLCVCPLCGEWQKYIAEIYARYARLEPEILWVEDDFRLHNHDPLVWGGCFCDEHMKIYSRLAGKKLTREEFIKGLLSPGKVHPYRKIWLDTARDTMLSAAENIGRAVRQESAGVKVGIMSSVPHIHAAEGRDWHAVINNLAQGRQGVNRIHLPGYSEVAPCEYIKNFNMVSHMTKAMLPEGCEVYPELENFPYSRYAKSKKFTRYQLLSSLSLGLDGITIDLYDLNGGGIVWSEGYQDMLRNTKPFLNDMNSTGVFKAARRGVHVMYSQKSAYTLQTKKGEEMQELYPAETFFAATLPASGVPFVYCDNINISGEILAISGQYLRNLLPEEIKRLFESNFVILNGDAAYTLFDMGLGSLAGIKSAHWEKENSGAYTFEQVTNGMEFQGMKNARASAVYLSSDALFCEYESEAREYTAFYDSFRTRRAPCEVVYNKVMIYPFGNLPDPFDKPIMFFNTLRAEIMHHILKEAGAAFPIVENAPYLVPYCFEKGGKEYLYLVNASTDDYAAAHISGNTHFLSIYRSNATQPTALMGNNKNYAVNIPSMETALLLAETEVAQ